jgi:hypothetical protein
MFLAVVVVPLLCAACGPFGYLKKVSKDASRAVADAHAVKAEEFSPYEYWGAVAYLEQAKVMMAYSEYERSFDYGTRSRQLAKEAKVKAERVERGESVERSDAIAAPDEVPEGEKPAEEKPAAPKPAEGAAKPSDAKPETKTDAKSGGGK